MDLGPDAEISGNLGCEGCEITGNRGAVKGDMMARGMALDLDESHGPVIIVTLAGFARRLRSLPVPCSPPCLPASDLGGQQG